MSPLIVGIWIAAPNCAPQPLGIEGSEIVRHFLPANGTQHTRGTAESLSE